MPQGSLAIYIVLLVIALAFSALFSSSEAILLSVQRVRLQYMVRSRVPGARVVARLVENPQRFLPTILLANNLTNTAAAALGTAVAVQLIDSEGLAVATATAVVTALLLVFGETIPKAVGVRHAESLSLIVAPPVTLLGRVLLPIVIVLNAIVDLALKPFGGTTGRTGMTEGELRAMISQGRESGAVASREARIMERVLRFAEHQVREVMVPRNEVVMVEKGAEMGEFLSLLGRRPRSHYPVYSSSPENVVGVLDASDVLRGLALHHIGLGGDVTVLARSAVFVPDTKLASELLEEMQEADDTAAIAVDEFGVIVGLVTIVKLGEEVMGALEFTGDIEDEEEEVEALDEVTFAVDGALRLHELTERMGLALPEGDYETVAGFLLERIGNIPSEGQQYRYGNVSFTITEMDGLRVEKVRIHYITPFGAEEPQSAGDL
ncbi:MAG: hemolysin family protein [Chloroflexi bacterium]|nr:hemolysin family protein [Chloroflexota bacterium]